MNETLKTILKKSIDRATQTGDFRIDNLLVQEYLTQAEINNLMVLVPSVFAMIAGCYIFFRGQKALSEDRENEFSFLTALSAFLFLAGLFLSGASLNSLFEIYYTPNIYLIEHFDR